MAALLRPHRLTAAPDPAMTTPPRTATPAATTTRADDRSWPDRTGEPGQILELLTTPELTFGIICAGLLAAMVWTAAPTMIKTGLVGAGLLLTGATTLVIDPPTLAAIVLLLVTAASLWFEIRFVPGLGLYAIFGGFALTLAGSTLHGMWQGAHPAAVVPLATLVATGTYIAGVHAWKRINADPMAATPYLTDRRTIVLHADGRRGYAVVAGRLWPIQCDGSPLAPGQHVRILDVADSTLIVEPAPASTDPSPDR